MIYLANPCTDSVRKQMNTGSLLGCISTPGQGNRIPPGAVWCADNGCFSDKFDEEKWWHFLQRRADQADTCLFAVAPDVVGDAAATLTRSAPWLPRIRALGYRAAFVAQDGQEDLPVPWDDIDVLFIGGTTAWKLGEAAASLVAEAKVRGKWVHMGRVNSWRRFTYARSIGCDSVDGTYISFGPDVRLPDVLAWVRSTKTQSSQHLTGG